MAKKAKKSVWDSITDFLHSAVVKSIQDSITNVERTIIKKFRLARKAIFRAVFELILLVLGILLMLAGLVLLLWYLLEPLVFAVVVAALGLLLFIIALKRK